MRRAALVAAGALVVALLVLGLADNLPWRTKRTNAESRAASNPEIKKHLTLAREFERMADEELSEAEAQILADEGYRFTKETRSQAIEIASKPVRRLLFLSRAAESNSHAGLAGLGLGGIQGQDKRLAERVFTSLRAADRVMHDANAFLKNEQNPCPFKEPHDKLVVLANGSIRAFPSRTEFPLFHARIAVDDLALC